MEITLEQSQKLANLINDIKLQLFLHDWAKKENIEFIFAAAKQLSERASWQESAAVLNPSHNPTKNDVLRVQAKSLEAFGHFIEGLIESDELKKKAAEEDQGMEQIRKMFL